MAFFSKSYTKQKRFLIAALVVLVLFSNNTLVNSVLRYYEAKYETYQNYDVGIIMGGFAGANRNNGGIEFYRSGDRAFQAIYLYRKGIVKKILISGGSIDKIESNKKEANLVAKYLREIGIPDSSILVEDQSRNTIENAKNSLQLITKINPRSKILVITSAVHIPRAKRIFSKISDQKITYYPTDYRAGDIIFWSSNSIPNADALLSWEILFKEWIGLVVDPIRL